MTSEQIELDRALGRYLDGEPEPDDNLVLSNAMARNPRFATEVRRLLIIDSLLCQITEADPAAFTDSIRTNLAAEVDAELFTRSVSKRLEPAAKGNGKRRPWLFLASTLAACLIVVACVVWSMLTSESSRHSPNVAVAVMVNEANAQFAPDAGPVAGSFFPGDYDLQAGGVHFRFTSGAEVMVRSPARFTLLDPMNMKLIEGALRAVVPSSARGFSVYAQDIRYEDLGTEFGVAVGEQPGESHLHVFEGHVELKTKQGKLLSTIDVGESVRVLGSKVEPIGLQHAEEFPTAGAIGLEKWLSWREQVQKDPAIFCYFPFIPEAAEPTLLKNHAPNHPLRDGLINGARWVTGRWPGKQALLFDRDGDYVSIEIPGEFRQLSFGAWICLDRCDFALNALLDSDSWRPGALHLQLTRTGEFFFGHWAKAKRKQNGSRVEPGAWTHVAAVADLDQRNTKTYVNGQLAENVRLASFPGALTPGNCRIGDWERLLDTGSVPNRGFRGKIDELALWRRALTSDEIQEMFVAGRTSFGSTQRTN